MSWDMSEPDYFYSCRSSTLADDGKGGHDRDVEPPISHQDVTTIMALLGDIHDDVARVRRVLEEGNGEEEASEDDG